MTNKTPDYCEPLIGWRAWVAWDDGELRSMFHDVTWPKRKALVAINSDEGHCWHLPVSGIYAYKTRVELEQAIEEGDMGQSVFLMIGTVALWGTVHVHERGYRAEFAYPSSFVFAGEGVDAEKFAADYGVPFQEDQTWTSAFKKQRSSWSRYNSLFQMRPMIGQMMWWPLLPPSKWSSPYLLHPDDVSLVEKPPTDEPLLAKYPGLPAGMVPPNMVPPARYQSQSGVWVPCSEDVEPLELTTGTVLSSDWDGSAYQSYADYADITE